MPRRGSGPAAAPHVSDAIYEVFDEIERVLGARVLSLRFELIVELALRPDTRPQHLRTRTCMSPASFYALLATLQVEGKITSRTDPRDRRARLYRLTHDAQQSYSRLYNLIPKWLQDDAERRCAPTPIMSDMSHRGSRIFRSPFFSTGYRLIIYLYEAGPLNPSALLRISELSSSTFFKTARRLVDRGTILSVPDPGDGRATLYKLPEPIRAFIHEQLMRSRRSLVEEPGWNAEQIMRLAAPVSPANERMLHA